MDRVKMKCDLCKQEDETTREYSVDEVGSKELIKVCDSCYEDSLSSY